MGGDGRRGRNILSCDGASGTNGSCGSHSSGHRKLAWLEMDDIPTLKVRAGRGQEKEVKESKVGKKDECGTASEEERHRRIARPPGSNWST